jgi:hypothetical protein
VHKLSYFLAKYVERDRQVLDDRGLTCRSTKRENVVDEGKVPFGGPGGKLLRPAVEVESASVRTTSLASGSRSRMRTSKSSLRLLIKSTPPAERVAALPLRRPDLLRKLIVQD